MTPFEELVSELDRAGLWSDTSVDEKHALIRTLCTGEDVTWTAGGAWRADGEDLADGGVEAWLSNMAAPLTDCGVSLRVATVASPFDEGSAGYSVEVNGTTLSLYAFSDDQPGVPAAEDPWMDCTVEPAAQVNSLLEAAGSTHRIGLFWPGGNDGFSVLGEQHLLQRIRGTATPSSSGDCLIA